MTNTVTLNGNTYNDSATPPLNMANGGHRTNLIPMLSDAVVDLLAKQTAAAASAATATAQAVLATTNGAAEVALATIQAGLATTNGAAQVVLATAQVGLATTQAAAAAASAASAAAIAGAFKGTSTTSLLIASGSKSFTTQTTDQYTPGIWMSAVSNANGANWMFGQVTSYSGSTLVLNISAIGGSGTYADWNLSLAGVQGPTGAPGTLSGTAVGTVDLLTGANIASAATINLDTATGNRVHITGTTTITAVTLTRGPRTIIFDGILTLTHNATTNNLPGAANITTAAGDRAIYGGDGTTVYCVNYIRANGLPVVTSSGSSAVNPTSATSITLTNQSVNVQNITMTAAGQAVIMAAANTFLAVGQILLVYNSGTIAFDLQDNTGQVIYAQLAPGKSVLVWLRDNTTVAGMWSLIGNQVGQAALMNGLSSASIAGFANAQIASCALNANQVLLCYTGGASSYTSYAVVLTSGGGANTIVTVGTPINLTSTTVKTTGAPYPIACCQTGTNSAVVVTSDPRVRALTVSGSTITLGAAVPFNIASNNGNAATGLAVSLVSTGTLLITVQGAALQQVFSIVATVSGLNVNVNGSANALYETALNGSLNLNNISTDIILATWQDLSTGYAYGQVITGASGIYTLGPVQPLLTTAYKTNPMQCVYIGNNQALLVYGDTANSNYCTAVVLSISGNTITINAKQQVQAYTAFVSSICQTSTGNALIHTYNSAATQQLYALSVTGTTVTVGTPVTATGPDQAGVMGSSCLVQSNTNKAIFAWWQASAGVYCNVVSVSGTTITYNAATTLQLSSVSQNPMIAGCTTNADQATICYIVANAGVCYLRCISSATATATAGTAVSGIILSNQYASAMIPTAATGAFIQITCGYQAIAGTISGSTITLGGAGAIISGNATRSSISVNEQFTGCISSSGRVIFAGIATANIGVAYGECFLANAQVSGTTITPPTYPTSFATGTPTFSFLYSSPNAAVPGSAVILYEDASYYGHAIYATVSGYAVTYGADLAYWNSSQTYGMAIAYLSANTWAVCYVQQSGSFIVFPLTVSGTTLTAGAAVSLGTSSSYPQEMSLAVLNGSQLLCGYMNGAVGINNISLINFNGAALSLAPGYPITVAGGGAGATYYSFCATAMPGTKVMLSFANAGGYSQLFQYVKV